jgi:transcriptional regulator with XRE-family HTH domain
MTTQARRGHKRTGGRSPAIRSQPTRLQAPTAQAPSAQTLTAPTTRPETTNEPTNVKALVDRHDRSAVDSRPSGGSAAGATPSVVPTSMEKEHFGTFLSRARENRDIVLADVALRTKVARSTLELIERGQLADLPAGVYVRGFIRSFARAVGTDETEPLLLFERALEAKSRAEKAREITPVTETPGPLPGANAEEEALMPRRGLGLAVFVIILLLIATITLSLLLRRPPPTGEGLSLAPAPPSSTESARNRSS